MGRIELGMGSRTAPGNLLKPLLKPRSGGSAFLLPEDLLEDFEAVRLGSVWVCREAFGSRARGVADLPAGDDLAGRFLRHAARRGIR